MSDAPLNVLFLCTHNSCRSLMAEAILNKLGGDKFKAYSAGSQPSGKINERALNLLQTLGHDTSKFRSKSWDEFAKPGAPVLDFIFTVCDDAAGESCPLWPGHPITAHWGLADPSQLQGTEAEIAVAFANTYRMLHARIGAFTSLPVSKLKTLTLTAQVRDIGRMEGATQRAKDQN